MVTLFGHPLVVYDIYIYIYYDVLRRTTTEYGVLRRNMTYYDDVLRRTTKYYDVVVVQSYMRLIGLGHIKHNLLPGAYFINEALFVRFLLFQRSRGK